MFTYSLLIRRALQLVCIKFKHVRLLSTEILPPHSFMGVPSTVSYVVLEIFDIGIQFMGSILTLLGFQLIIGVLRICVHILASDSSSAKKEEEK